VAVTWLGYPDTTGLASVDYRITDLASDPEGSEAFFTERPYRLPSGSVVYRPPEPAPDIVGLRARAPGAVMFGNFDDPRKIVPGVVQAWSSILKALPAAHLLLQAPPFADPGFLDRFSAHFRSSGIDPERVEMRPPPSSPDEHLASYAEADIVLDSFPYNATPTTTCEALWMGVPVVTLSGDRSCARVSAGLLAQVGLERLICDDESDYIATTVQLAENLHRLRTLRANMRNRMRVSPLLDERGFARRFEAALRDIWLRWCWVLQ
jgi:predicted O-linked N-acetylglucosamine transferase (SPINDLY family)